MKNNADNKIFDDEIDYVSKINDLEQDLWEES